MMRRRRWQRFFSGTHPVAGNQLRLFQSGVEFFPALVAAIDAASAEIYLETYIFHADASMAVVRDALVRAARRGVEVRLLIDGIGSHQLPPSWLDALKEAGVGVLVYRPLRGSWHISRLNLRRLHRKQAVIDGRVAFVGGINLIDDFEPLPLPKPRLDFCVEVQGPLLADIHQNVSRLWQLVALTQLETEEWAPSIEPSAQVAGDIRAAYVVRDNLAHRRDIERVYLAAIALAENEIVLANAYFLPGYRFRKLLKAAAARGVQVHLLVQGHTDHPFFQLAARALYRDLLTAGVHLYEYRASELHAKVAVVDGHWATVGSSNIDPFSLLMAREANIVVDDSRFASDLRQRLQQALNDADRLDAADWRHRAWPRRMVSWFAYESVRLLVGLAGAGRWL